MAIITSAVVDREMEIAVKPDIVMEAMRRQNQMAGTTVADAMVGAMLGSKHRTFTVTLN